MVSRSPGLLGAAPTMPLLANPALSAALLQLLLQNQAQVQQVTVTPILLVCVPPSPFHSFLPFFLFLQFFIGAIFFLILSYQQAFLGNHLLWAQVLHNKENRLLPCVSEHGVGLIVLRW